MLFFTCKDQKNSKIPTEINNKTPQKLLTTIDSTDFNRVMNGKEVRFFVIQNKNGIEASFTNYGQRLISLYVPDRDGNMKDIVLGFSNLEDYINSKEPYFGATIGRYANRIAKGKFQIDETTYELATNNGDNHLHGGPNGFHNVVWTANQISTNEIEFTRTSPNMEEGYPGNLEVKVNYVITDDNELKIRYFANADKQTPINLTHHSFFNLKGEGEDNINDHVLMINADHYTPIDSGLIPTGDIAKVTGTPFDFAKPKPIKKDIKTQNQQLGFGNGYDHNFVLNNTPKNAEGLVLAAKVMEPNNGRVMEVYTDEPGLQFYGGNFLDGSIVGKSGKAYEYRGSFCLETQHFPDSPNQKNFPSTLLSPSETYTSTCVYKFSTY